MHFTIIFYIERLSLASKQTSHIHSPHYRQVQSSTVIAVEVSSPTTPITSVRAYHCIVAIVGDVGS
jgi:hypothetical protein